jgi:hypothetical protein
MGRTAGVRNRAVKGFVVKIMEAITDPTTHVVVRKTREVSRLYHSRDAAVVCCDLFKKLHPNDDYYVTEKTGRDDAEIY